MCDYSLMTFPNRLANEGETLVTHKFSTGSIGFVSPIDLCAPVPVRPPCVNVSFWGKVRGWIAAPPARPAIPAVCIPPGAHLILKDIPADLQRQCRVSEEEGVMFTQLSADVNSYRDAIRFNNGYQIRLQDLREGMRVEVLSLAGVTEYTPAMTEALR